MNSRLSGFTLLLAVLVLSSSVTQQPYAAAGKYEDQRLKLSSPFSLALEALQKQIGYNFTTLSLLRRAVTHASFSEENNKALSILGNHLIEASVSFHSLENDIDMSSKELNSLIVEISKVNSSCAVDGMKLGLHKVVRVSPRTDPSNAIIVCGAFRAIFGAIAIDSGNSDVAGNIFWSRHHGSKVRRAVSF